MNNPVEKKEKTMKEKTTQFTKDETQIANICFS